MSISRTGVLIVGAGPAGLAVANMLLRFGYRDFRIVDAGGDFGEGGRAVNLWARTQEILHLMGVRERLLDRSVLARGSHLNAYGNYVGFQPFDQCPSRFPRVLSLVQSEIHRGMGEGVVVGGGRIEFNTSLTSISQQDGGVRAVLAHEDGTQEELTARYVVAADGGRSSIREMLGIGFDDYDVVDARIHQIDGELTWSLPTLNDEWHLYIRENGQSGIVPLPGGVSRVFVCEALADALPGRNATPEEMTERLRVITGDPQLTVTNPVWASHGRLTTGIADNFRAGDVFLIGDAGHKVLPVGGQGANQAIHDGFNLGWKLATVMRGDAKDWILDTYHDERHAIRTQLAIEQSSSFQRMIQPSADQVERTLQMARDFAGQSSRATDLPDRDLQMLDINYPESRLSEDHLDGGVAAGDRAGDAIVVDLAVDRSDLWLSDILYHGGWTLLAFDNGETGDAVDALRAALTRHARAFSLPYRFCAGSLETAALLRSGSPALIDAHRRVHDRFAISAPTIYAIRPDGHIGFRGGAAHLDALEAYLDRVLVRPTA